MSIVNQLSALFCTAFEDMGFEAKLGAVFSSARDDAPFQCNGAMGAAGALKKQGEKVNPRDIAAKIVECVKDAPQIESLQIAGPGFINIVPAQEVITARANALWADPRTGALWAI